MPSSVENTNSDEVTSDISDSFAIIYQVTASNLFIEQTWLQYLTYQMTEQQTNVEIITQTLEPSVDVSIDLPVAANLQQESYLYIYVIAVVILVIGLIAILNRKSKPSKKEIGLVGERGSGKTQLFIGLCGGKHFETVPSIVNNTSTIEIGNKKTYKICDFIGDNLSKEEIISELPRFHTIVHVVDGTDSKKLSDAALFIYRMLINKVFQKDPCNYVLFLNKDDDKSFHGVEKLVKRIEDEIETIKSSRRNQPEDNEGEEDYLRNERTRFSLKNQGIIAVSGSARTNRAKLEEQLEQICG